MILAFYKPFRVLCRFTDDGSGNIPLSKFNFPKNVYPLGRLDADSEGLLLLSDEPGLNSQLLHPDNAHTRTYMVQVDRIPEPESLKKLRAGLDVGGHRTRPCRVHLMEAEPDLPPREPPIRFRKNVPTAWLEMELTEGKNRQVRRMTAAIGYPTLRLVRSKIGNLTLEGLLPGKWKKLSLVEQRLFL